jgi:hypothetical protein
MSDNRRPGGSFDDASSRINNASRHSVWSSDEYLDEDEKVSRSYVVAARLLLIPIVCGFIGAKIGTMRTCPRALRFSRRTH